MKDDIVRTTKRIKDTGEVFTPRELVNELLDQLVEHDNTLFTNPDKVFCDPCCGNGQFLVEIMKRKLGNGHNLHKVSSTVYGVDIMPDNIEVCKSRLRGILEDHMEALGRGRKLNGGVNDNITNNIICHDSLQWDFKNWQKSRAERQKDKTDSIIGAEG